MASLAQFSELVGFFSYSREDDEAFRGSLSALRDAIQRVLSAQPGRSRRDFPLWQDQEAIAPGQMWESRIAEAVEEAVFFIPIVTPRAIASKHCKFEFKSFLARERALGRNDLVFPIHYIRVPGLMDEAEWSDDPVLSIVAKRQYVDWRSFRYESVDTRAFGHEIDQFCEKIAETLRRRWISPEEHRELEAGANMRAENEERALHEAEAKRENVNRPKPRGAPRKRSAFSRKSKRSDRLRNR
jgi:TIR domain